MTTLNTFSLALKSMRHKPLSTVLNVLLLAVGVAMMTFVLSASRQLERSALRDAGGIDLVVGAKGSPLQLILSSIYHIDTPTGNIPLSAQAGLASNRLVRKVIPLALGDSYHGFRIVGTNADYAALYDAKLASGAFFNRPMQAVLGAQAAARTGARIGASFTGSHGMASADDMHSATPYTVVGIMQPTNSVLDRLVLTPVESVWQVHETGHHAGPEEAGHDAHDDKHEQQEHAENQRELTALLVQYASPLAAVSLPRLVNSQNALQAAQPALESAKLFRMLGVGVDVLRGIAAIVLLSAALSMFVALYSALEERKTDLAILRTLGAPPSRLFVLLLTEGVLLALAGAAVGWLLGHVGVEILGRMLSADQNLSLSGWVLVPEEAWLWLAAVATGVVAALIPAVRAYRTDIAATLAR